MLLTPRKSDNLPLIMIAWFLNLLRVLKVCPGRVRSMVDGYSRVEWDVNRFPLWFESRDAELDDELLADGFVLLGGGVQAAGQDRTG